MGAWGTASFENDAACDWVYELERSQGDEFLMKTLKEAQTQEYLDSHEACCAIGAAEVVTALMSRPCPGLMDGIEKWVASHRDLPTNDLAEQARRSLERILSAKSELLELWEDSDELENWKASLHDLQRRLTP
jgi:hypothetical protein